MAGIGGGGVAGAGGGGMAGAGSGGMAGGGPVSCSFTVTTALSVRIPTVGIVDWSTDLPNVNSARIEFGLDTSYGMTAPVSLAEPNYRTLLLGMKASRTYHFRIVAQAGTSTCTSSDRTILTGPLPSNLPSLDVTTTSARAGGFLLIPQYQGSAAAGTAYIVDADGDIVWWYAIGGNASGARMSYDGRYMWINGANVPETQGANVHRVSMDGVTDENLSSAFAGQRLMLSVLPDETVAFFAYSANDCEDIKERAPNGTVRPIVNTGTVHGATAGCDVRAVEYSPDDDTLLISDYGNNSVIKVRRNGEVVWVLGGPASDFTGVGATWDRQSGVDALTTNQLLIFNNGSPGGTGSLAIEIAINLGSMAAFRTFTYQPMPAINNQIMGDVQRLWNGNTIVAYSVRGELHEVTPAGLVAQQIVWPIGHAFGHVVKRQTLYGPPPR
jgi:hypothetical protein